MPARKKSDAPIVVIFPGTPKPRRRRAQSPTTKLKRKIANATGIPTTAAGRKRKEHRPRQKHTKQFFHVHSPLILFAESQLLF